MEEPVRIVQTTCHCITAHRSGARIYEQLKALGGSFDWSREQFTMNDRCYKYTLRVA
jgi:valyl-tRNA synthetase